MPGLDRLSLLLYPLFRQFLSRASKNTLSAATLSTGCKGNPVNRCRHRLPHGTHGGVAHRVGYLIVTDSSSLVPTFRPLVDGCSAATGIRRAGEPTSAPTLLALRGFNRPV
jgi:hypothetical protein